MRLSFTIAGREFSLGTAKTVSSSVASFLRGDDVTDGAGATLTQPYGQSAWVYVAVNRMARKISSLPFRISTMDDATARKFRAVRRSADPRHREFCRRAMGENIVECGPVCDLFDQPHATMSRQLFWEMVVTWLKLRGEFFVMPLDAADMPVDLTVRAPKVVGLVTLAPEMFWHVVQGYTLSAWRYTGAPLLSPVPSEMLLPGEVIHSRTPNPYLYWRGLSPIAVAAVGASADYAAAKYNQGYWLNNADTGLIVSSEGWPTQEQRAAILAALRERKRKAGSPDRPLFLGGGVKVEKPQLSGMETQFIENRKMNRQEIGAILETPESVMGFTDQKSSALSGGGAAINQEMLGWLLNTIAPTCCQLEDALDPVVKSFGPNLCGWFDVESDPMLQEARRARWDTATKAFGIGVAFNDLNRIFDLGCPEYAWGNTSYLPFNLQPAGPSEPMPSETPPTDPADTEQDSANPFARMAQVLAAHRTGTAAKTKSDTKLLWESHIKTRRKMIAVIQAKAGKVIAKYRASTLAKLDELQLGKDIAQRNLVDIIFNAHAFGVSMESELRAPIAATLQQAGNELRQEIGLDDPWTMPPELALDYQARRSVPLQTTGDTARSQINTALSEGMTAGEGTKELGDRLRAVFNSLGAYEAKRIAMTETNMAYNFARQESMRGAGIAFKAWLSSHGPHVRPAHALAEELYIDNPIPIDQPFEVMGEQLMFPGDDSLGASPENVINCQCVQLASVKVSSTPQVTTYHIHGFGPLEVRHV